MLNQGSTHLQMNPDYLNVNSSEQHEPSKISETLRQKVNLKYNYFIFAIN